MSIETIDAEEVRILELDSPFAPTEVLTYVANLQLLGVKNPEPYLLAMAGIPVAQGLNGATKEAAMRATGQSGGAGTPNVEAQWFSSSSLERPHKVSVSLRETEVIGIESLGEINEVNHG